MNDAEKLLVLNDFFAWSGGTLPESDGQIIAYLECSYPFEGFDEDERASWTRMRVVANCSILWNSGICIGELLRREANNGSLLRRRPRLVPTSGLAIFTVKKTP